VQKEQAEHCSADASSIVGEIGEPSPRRARLSLRQPPWLVTRVRTPGTPGQEPTKSDGVRFADSKRRQTISQPVVCGLLRFWEAAWVFASALLSAYFFGYVLHPGHVFEPMDFALVGLVAAFWSSATFSALGAYEFAKFSRVGWQTRCTLGGWAIMVLVFLSALFLTKTSAHYSRGWFVCWFTMGALGLVSGRLVIGGLITRWTETGKLRRRVAILGGGAEARRFIEECRASTRDDAEIIGIFDDRKTRIVEEVDGIKRLGDVEALIEGVRAERIDEIILALPGNAIDRINSLMTRIRMMPIEVKLWIDLPVRRIAVADIEYRDGVPVATLLERPVKHWGALSKRVADLILSTILLATLGWLSVIAAVVIKLESRGPVLFKQRRFGFNGRAFEIYKFRTMYARCTDLEAERLVTRCDVRVTRVGRFLRHLNLDELPQLINVIKGDMSLVGPRPHPVRAKAGGQLYPDAVEEYAARFRVKPGMTGWAQVNGWRGETDTVEKLQKRVEHDLFYIQNWSLGFDLWILFLTVVRGFTDKNAY
jgi:Undecaprenyl-phosphate glucose phosphotransferase